MYNVNNNKNFSSEWSLFKLFFFKKEGCCTKQTLDDEMIIKIQSASELMIYEV